MEERYSRNVPAVSAEDMETLRQSRVLVAGCGGLGEFYDVLKGTGYADISGQLGGIMSVTYSPSMIKTAIQDMEDYLAGQDVEQDHVIACEIVTSENVDNYEAFN